MAVTCDSFEAGDLLMVGAHGKTVDSLRVFMSRYKDKIIVWNPQTNQYTFMYANESNMTVLCKADACHDLALQEE